MDPKKINQFRLLINSGKLSEASELIPEILSYSQYRSFCLKVEKYLCAKERRMASLPFHLALLQTVVTEDKEQNLIEADARHKMAEEDAELARKISEDAEASFDIMSERAAKIFDKDIIAFALIELALEEKVNCL